MRQEDFDALVEKNNLTLKEVPMKKQTAVEWLFAHLLPFLEFSDPNEREHFRKCLAEAIAMEKEQIIESWEYGDKHEPWIIGRKTGEQYYNETYEK